MTQFAIAAGVAVFIGAAIQKGFRLHPMHLIASVAVIILACVFAAKGRPAVEGLPKNILDFLDGKKVLVAGAVAGLFLGDLLARLTHSD